MRKFKAAVGPIVSSRLQMIFEMCFEKTGGGVSCKMRDSVNSKNESKHLGHTSLPIAPISELSPLLRIGT